MTPVRYKASTSSSRRMGLIAYPAGNEGPTRAINRSCIAYDTLCMGGFTRAAPSTPPTTSLRTSRAAARPPGGGRSRIWSLSRRVSSPTSTGFVMGGCGAVAAARHSPHLRGLRRPRFSLGRVSAPSRRRQSSSTRRARAARRRAAQWEPNRWQADWGWGALNLEEAARDRTNFYTHEIAAETPTSFAPTSTGSANGPRSSGTGVRSAVSPRAATPRR